MPPPPPPKPPARDQCEGQSGIVALSDLNWFEKIFINHQDQIQRAEKVWVNGTVDELHIGTKWEIIEGQVTEAHEKWKLEQIIINEDKINIGTLTEMFLALRFKYNRAWVKEFNLGPKLEIWPSSGQVWDGYWTHKSAMEKREHDKAREVIVNYEKTVMATAKQDIENAKWAMNSLQREIKFVKTKITDLSVKSKENELDGDFVTVDASGTWEHSAGTFIIQAGKKVKLNGADVTIQGGGDKVECKSGKVLVNGTDIVVKE